jgi:hypothetical protein
MFFDYNGEIKFVQFYDFTNKKAVKHDGKTYIVGSVMTEVDYRDGMFLPPVGTIVRFQSVEYNGFYRVISWMYLDNTGVLRLTVEKATEIDPYRGSMVL